MAQAFNDVFLLVTISVGVMYLLLKFELHKYIYDVRIGSDSLEFFVFRRWVIFKKKYKDILSCEIVGAINALGASFISYRNRFFSKAILIHLNKTCAFAYSFVISPENPEEFFEELKKKITKHKI